MIEENFSESENNSAPGEQSQNDQSGSNDKAQNSQSDKLSEDQNSSKRFNLNEGDEDSIESVQEDKEEDA